MTKERQQFFDDLRNKAETLLHDGELDQTHLQVVRPQVEELLHELETYDAELYLQNLELRRHELNLENSLNRFETLFMSLPLAALVVDKRGLIMQGNDNAAELFSFRSRDTLEGHSLLRLVADKDRNDLFNSLAQQVRNQITHLGPLAIGEQKPRLVDFQLTRLPESYHFDFRILITCIDRTEHYRHLDQMALLKGLDR